MLAIMFAFRFSILAFFALFTLTGCFGTASPYLSEPTLDYTLASSSGEIEPHLKDYLGSVLSDDLAAPFEASNAAELERLVSYRTRQIQSNLEKAMRARGYYDGQVVFEAVDTQTGSYIITSGEQYSIGSVDITPKRYAGLIEGLGVHTGDPLEAALVLKAQRDLREKIDADGCSVTLKVKHSASLHPSSHTASLHFHVETGPDSVFGDLHFEGQERVKNSYLQHLIPWSDGDCFKHSKVQTLRENLLGSGLFSNADIRLGAPAPGSHSIPVTVSLKERAPRTVRAGLSYYTDSGPGAVFGWEHRNFFGHAETLTASMTLSALEQSLTSEFTKPYFRHPKQSLFLTATIDRQNTDAYEELAIAAGGRLNRKFSKTFSGSAGVSTKITRITEDDGTEETFGLVSFPVSVLFDNRDDTLDPHRGAQLRASVHPFVDAFGQSSPFVKTVFSGSAYYSLHERVVLAARSKIGMIAGTESSEIPASERFYAGGGGSVRGYGYQEIGPIEGNDPIGGRSLIEMSGEVRFKITDMIGAVAFVDGGNVTEKPTPEFSDLSIGAGMGLRYYTGFGPVRLDVATPLTHDDRVDQNYQIYISIGQAF